MADIYIITHGRMCEGILDSVEMIMGSSEGITAVSLQPEQSLEDLKEIICQLVHDSAENEIIIFVDMYGATPFNASVLSTRDIRDQDKTIKIMSGVNLPMTIEALSMNGTDSAEKICANLLVQGKDSISIY